MTFNYKTYKEGNSGYRPGTLNVQVNGIQIEDLYQKWVARSRECEKLREENKNMSELLKKQGSYIEELKEKIKNVES